MTVTADKPAPYATPSTILDVIGRYRTRGLPSPVNADVLGRAGVSDSLIPRTIQALQTLDLIDDAGKPTQTFEGLRLAPEAEYKSRLADWLKGAYADVFSFVDPTTDDEVRVRDAFRSYQPVGQQARMVTLFQGLCAAAGLVREGAPIQQTRPAARSPAAQAARPASKPKATPKLTSLINATHTSSLPPALSGLLANLPTHGNGWTQEDRDRFMTAFDAIVAYCFPIVERNATDEQEKAQE